MIASLHMWFLLEPVPGLLLLFVCGQHMVTLLAVYGAGCGLPTLVLHCSCGACPRPAVILSASCCVIAMGSPSVVVLPLGCSLFPGGGGVVVVKVTVAMGGVAKFVLIGPRKWQLGECGAYLEEEAASCW